MPLSKYMKEWMTVPRFRLQMCFLAGAHLGIVLTTGNLFSLAAFILCLIALYGTRRAVEGV